MYIQIFVFVRHARYVNIHCLKLQRTFYGAVQNVTGGNKKTTDANKQTKRPKPSDLFIAVGLVGYE